MDLRQLECFVSVAEVGRFTKAAAMLSITQPTLSRIVRQLEVELRKNLLRRHGRGVRLTEEGSIFLAHAKGMLEQAERARQEIASYRSSPTGKVIIGTLGAAKTALITDLVTIFKERFPKASLEVVTIRDLDIAEWLSIGRIDIGILSEPSPSSGIEITPLQKHQFYLVSSASTATLAKSSEIPFRQLAKYPLILPRKPHIIRRLLEKAALKVDIKLDVALQIEGVNLILALVHKGHGHGILTSDAVGESYLREQLQINPIVKPRIVRTLTIAISSQRPTTYLAQETVKLILKHFENEETNG